MKLFEKVFFKSFISCGITYVTNSRDFAHKIQITLVYSMSRNHFYFKIFVGIVKQSQYQKYLL